MRDAGGRPFTTDYREDQPRWRLTAAETGLRVYLRAPTKTDAKAMAERLYGPRTWKAKRRRG